ncbi:hypothetical protein M3914_003368 [Vibrio metschnikovii]|nr:hypothetical protein [Vibrio metschnikovii]
MLSKIIYSLKGIWDHLFNHGLEIVVALLAAFAIAINDFIKHVAEE